METQKMPFKPLSHLVLFTFAILAFTHTALAQVAAPPQTEELQKSAEATPDEQNDKKAAAKEERGKRKKDSADFMRIRKDHRGRDVALETSITRYVLETEKGERITVDLIGAVHIGEKSYFEKLNKRFESYESMLYELVAPEGTIIPKGGGPEEGIPTNPIAAMQVGMKAALGLEFQLEHVDYTKKNFVHADMTPEEFSESMVANDESISKYAVRAIGQSMAMQAAGKGGDSMGMLFAMFSKNKELRLRRSFAKQLKNMEAGMVVFQGKDGSTIIDHRNAKCMKVLESEIAAGKRKIADFYGAGHLPDMQRRLLSDFKMKRGGQVWLEAWSLTDRGKNKDKSSEKK